MGNKERMFFEAGTDDLSVQAVAFAGGRDVSFSCNDEWCGDTESGFGATVSVSIGREDAENLRDFLDAWLKTPNAMLRGAVGRTVKPEFITKLRRPAASPGANCYVYVH